MNEQVQFIEVDGQPAFAVVPVALWRRLAARAEDIEDADAIAQAKAADDGARIPGAVAFAIAGGTHPVRAWREHHAMTQAALAQAAGISKGYLSQVEAGRRTGTVDTLRALAQALGVTFADLDGSD